MAKLTLKAAPTFVAAVDIPVTGAEPVAVKFTFRHRTQTELKELIAADSNPEAPARSHADYVMDVAVGWELDDEFTRENVELFCEHYNGASPAITERYLKAYAESRLGNLKPPPARSTSVPQTLKS